MAEARHVDGDDTVPFGQRGNVLEPVLPTACEPVYEHQRGAFSELDIVHARAVHLNLAQMLLPVDVQPLGAPLRSVVIPDGEGASFP